MSVSTYGDGAKFIFRITKYHLSNSDRKWANSYEAVATASGSETELLGLGLALVEFEQAIHYSYAVFDRLLISTWEEDSKPYDPSAFIASPLTAVGLRSAEFGLPVGLNQCLDVRRQTAFGRFGHLFYRACLSEGEVEAPAGKTKLTNRPAMQTIVDGAITSSSLDDYLAGGTGGLQLVMIRTDVEDPRAITQLKVGQVSVVPFEHTWFNRTAP